MRSAINLNNVPIRASLLDRLLDDEPHLQEERDPRWKSRLLDLRNGIRRDLEDLLNARCRVLSPPAGSRHLSDSILNYGLPDLATINMLDTDRKRVFTRDMENIIRAFEPRFKSVRVQFLENVSKSDRALRFRIDAVMYAHPAPEVVVFDSVLEPLLRTVTVEESPHVG